MGRRDPRSEVRPATGPTDTFLPSVQAGRGGRHPPESDVGVEDWRGVDRSRVASTASSGCGGRVLGGGGENAASPGESAMLVLGVAPSRGDHSA